MLCLYDCRNTGRDDMTENMTIALKALRSAAESDNGNGFFDVYLDNARPDGWSGKKWSGVLANLAKVGLYQDIDYDCFGAVKMDS